MPSKNIKPEDIVRKLGQVEVLPSQGKAIATVAIALVVTSAVTATQLGLSFAWGASQTQRLSEAADGAAAKSTSTQAPTRGPALAETPGSGKASVTD